MNTLLPIIMALGYGLGGSALGGTTGALIGAGLGLGGGMLLNKQYSKLPPPYNRMSVVPPQQVPYQSYNREVQEQYNRLNTITTLALLLAGLGGGFFAGKKL